MGNSIEKPANLEIVFGDMAYDESRDTIECPPSTVNNRKKLPQKGKEIPDGEISINVGYARYKKDDNGKITSVQFLNKEEVPKMPEISGEFKGEVAENGEIIRPTVGSER